jgi:predicted fused transcriptional regulator/phosphomethylpyrimidine kinase/predicted transcriptional regulator
MRFIEEVVVEEFLPTVRSMLAEELRERGLTQSEVAEVLGISQSAVSKYAHGDVERRELFAADERVRETVEEIAAGLATGDTRPVGALIELEVLIRRLEDGGPISQLHERQMPELAEYGADFRIHDPDSELRTRERVRSSLQRSLRTLENTGGFATLIPAVGSNLVACLPDAERVEDVAGVPGRIFDVKGKVEVPGAPEFGVSEHVAGVLLAARAAGSDAQAAINVRYDEEIIDALDATGLAAAEFESGEDVAAGVEAALVEMPGATVLYHTGDYGIEPIVYVLGESPADVVASVRQLL